MSLCNLLLSFGHRVVAELSTGNDCRKSEVVLNFVLTLCDTDIPHACCFVLEGTTLGADWASTSSHHNQQRDA